MRKSTLQFIAILFSYLLFSCGNNQTPTAVVQQPQKVAIPTGTTFLVDTASSVIDWKASHRGGLTPRWGTLKIKSGSVSVNDSMKISGGSFVMNMYSITVDSASVIEPGKNHLDLQNHLKSKDFFYTENFPEATFEITNVAAYDSISVQKNALLTGATNVISGNLKLKDSTINVTFPAKILLSDSTMNVEAKFIFDRTKWGLNYKEQGAAQNWMISNDIQLGIRLKANKK